MSKTPDEISNLAAITGAFRYFKQGRHQLTYNGQPVVDAEVNLGTPINFATMSATITLEDGEEVSMFNRQLRLVESNDNTIVIPGKYPDHPSATLVIVQT